MAVVRYAMPVLRDTRRERFAQNMASGLPAIPSYMDAGYKVSPSAASAAAARLHNRPEVRARIDELLERRSRVPEQTLHKAVVTREWVLDHLIQNVQRAMQIIPPTKEGGLFRYEGSVANKALELLGKEVGMFVDRKEVGAPGEFAELDAEGLRSAIAERITMVRQGDGSFTVPREEGGVREESD